MCRIRWASYVELDVKSPVTHMHLAVAALLGYYASHPNTDQSRHSQTYAIVTCRKVWRKNFAQFGIKYLYMQGSPTEIQTSTHCNMTAPSPVLSPSSILFHKLLLIQLSIPQGKIRCTFQKCDFIFLLF